jgi:basic membrane protein A
VLTGAAQQAVGALRAVGDAQYANRYIWWMAQDMAMLTTPEGAARSIAASSYNYEAVIVGFVQKLDAGVSGGECVPMNYNNGGFLFEFNQNLPEMVTPEVKAKVDETLANFRAAPNTINWSVVDYTKL